ncbi:MAG: hypothetical protein K6T75_08970 [Acetobacteraceae bacterium]|nr:hypothetical protein [Acetobacteraceae bacterium]
MREIITPLDLLKHEGVPPERVAMPPNVVMCHQPPLVKAISERAGAKPRPDWPFQNEPYSVVDGSYRGVPFSMFISRITGAPAAALRIEELGAAGGRRFIGVNAVGSLDAGLPLGSLVVPILCYRDEGTSSHYLPCGGPAVPSDFMVRLMLDTARDLGITVTRTHHWTTDGLYRELKPQVDYYRRLGVVSVDMETSAMYAVCWLRGFQAVNLGVVCNYVTDPWKPAYLDEGFANGLKAAAELVLETLARLPEGK